MFSRDLENVISSAYQLARKRRQELMTVEHLLLALLDEPTAADVLLACDADLNKLRTDLTNYISENVSILPDDDERDTQPTMGFQRVLQRAVMSVQTQGRKEVLGKNILVAILAENDTHSVDLLRQQEVSRLDVVNYISHGIAKTRDDYLTEPRKVHRPAAAPSKSSATAPFETKSVQTQSPLRLSVLIIKLEGYAQRLEAIVEHIPNAAQLLNEQIQKFLADAIADADLLLPDTLLKANNEGAILQTLKARRAHRIAVSLQQASYRHNANLKHELAKRCFSVAIATGEVSQHSGSTIDRAAYILADCKPGEVIIDAFTYQELPKDLQELYQGPTPILDKDQVSDATYRYMAYK